MPSNDSLADGWADLEADPLRGYVLDKLLDVLFRLGPVTLQRRRGQSVSVYLVSVRKMQAVRAQH